MSYTTIKAVWPSEKHADVEVLRNSHGSAPVVWNQMAMTYLGMPEFHYSFDDSKLWPLWKRMDIPKSHRALLTMTYDDAYVAKANYARAAADIRAFLADFPPNPERVNHWPHIANLLESSPDYPAMAFHWTSVCCDPYAGPYNEETDEYDAPDWSKYWEMYAALDELDAPAAAPLQNVEGPQP